METGVHRNNGHLRNGLFYINSKKRFSHMKCITILFFLIILGLPYTAFGQSLVVTIDEAVDIALQNNREIGIAAMEIRKSRAAVREAFGYALPTVDVSGNFSRFLRKPRMPFPDFEALLGNATYSILFDEGVLPRDEDKFKDVTTQLQSFAQTNNYESQILVMQPLFNSTVLRGIGASRRYLNLSEEELQRTISSTILEVKRSFYAVLLTKEMYEIARASFDNATGNLRNVSVAYEQGLVAEFDLLQAEVQVENIRPMVLQSENALKNAMDGFKIVLNIDQETNIDVVGEMLYDDEPVPDPDQTIEVAHRGNYGIKALEIKKDVDRAFIDYYQSEYWPVLYAFGNYTYAGSDERYSFQNYSSSIVGVTLSINLFNGGRSRQRVQQARVTMNQTEQQLEQYRDYVAMQVKSKINDLRRVQSILGAQERSVNLAERAYSIAVVRYREGTGNQLEVQNADIALRQARTNRLNSVYDYIIARAELDHLAGRIN
jgi:outer membrane protein